MSDASVYFAHTAQMTEPGPYSQLLDGLTTTIGELCRIVQNTTIHIFWAERYGLSLTGERKAEVQLRTLQRRLGRMQELDPHPLKEARPAEKKIVGNCRDFTLLLVSILRHQGIPARARCGFGTYFIPDHFEDHWVAEYWDSEQMRWILVDAQLDPLQCEVLKIPFNPLDVPRDRFIVGGKAWQMCRNGQADPKQFGIFDMNGLGFVRGDFVRDVASLNKVELLPWDCWGIIEKLEENDPDDLKFLDALAELTCGEVLDFEMVRNIYQSDARLRADGVIHSYGAAGIETIQLSV